MAGKKGMFAGRPPSPATRRGNGRGWGGQAKGEGNKVPFSADDEFRGAYNAESIAARIADMDEIKRLYTEVLRSKDEPTPNRLNAADKLADRIEGKPVQKNINENTNVRTVIRAPAKPADAREWMQQHQPKPKTLNS